MLDSRSLVLEFIAIGITAIYQLSLHIRCCARQDKIKVCNLVGVRYFFA